MTIRKAKGAKDYRKAIHRIVAEVKAGTIVVRGQEGLVEAAVEASGACKEACRNHGGVDICGHSFVVCNDGEIYFIDP